MSFRCAATSIDIQELMDDPVRCPSTVSRYVREVATLVRDEYAHEFAVCRENSELFSISIDEWTSVANRSYLSIILYVKSGTKYDLGIVPLIEGTSAVHIRTAIDKHLQL